MRDLSDTPIDSEHYRQELVRDYQRRFDEWHTEFLRYQEEFIKSVDNYLHYLLFIIKFSTLIIQRFIFMFIQLKFRR